MLFCLLIHGPAKGTFWFVMPMLVSGITTMILTRITIGTLSRLGPKLIARCTNKEGGVKFLYGMGALLGSFTIATLILVYFFFTLIYKNMYFSKKGPLEFEMVFLLLTGHVFGISLCLIFYRECGSLVSKGIAVGSEFVNQQEVNNDEALVFYGDIDQASVVTSIIANTLSNILDYWLILNLVIAAGSIIEC